MKIQNKNQKLKLNLKFFYLLFPLLQSCPTPTNKITGTEADDVLNGTIERDLIRGLEGNDTIYGKEGNDELYGGKGNDTIDGGKGNDIIDGGEGIDSIDGGKGIDTVSYENSTKGVSVNLKTNTHSGGEAKGDNLANVENIVGSKHDDNLTGDNNDNVIIGTGGSNAVYGEEGNDNIYGADGNDTIYGGNGDDIIEGKRGDDIIYGGGGSDTISGDRGNDTIDGGSGADFIDGGWGNDTVSYESSRLAVNINLETSAYSGGDAQGDSLVNIENIIGSNHNDRLIGNNSNNIIYKGRGRDYIDGRGGFDTLKTNGILNLTIIDDIISNIQKIDITGGIGENSSLTLNSTSLLRLGGISLEMLGRTYSTVFVEGDAGDAVRSTENWTNTNQVYAYNDIEYNVFALGLQALLVSPQINTDDIV